MRIDLENGKYTYVFDKSHQYALRHGEPWKDLTGDKFVYCLAAELEEAREQHAAIAAHNEILSRIIMSSNKADEPHTMSALNTKPENSLAFRDAHKQADILEHAAGRIDPNNPWGALRQMAKELRDAAYRESM